MTDPLTSKQVVILGLARQGTALAAWLCKIGAKVVISDLRPAEQLWDEMAELDGLEITYVLGEHPLYLLNQTDVLCLSGGVPLDTPLVEEAIAQGITLSNDAQIFVDRCPCHVIGITGSAGKTTTTALVGAMCEAAGMLPWVGGNIGNPLISDLPYIRPSDIAIMEMSSFQLEIMTTSPHIAAVLNITPNHLDRHKTMEAYVNAKARILENQVVGDVAVLGLDDPGAMSLEPRIQAQAVFFSGHVPVDVGAWLVGDKLLCRPRFSLPMEPVCTTADLNLRGYHNILNTLAACAIAGAADVPVSAMREAVLKFQPVEHRLEIVRELNGVRFINDSIATAPERVMAALKSFYEPLVLLLGGRDKKLPWDEMLAQAIRQARTIITFGEAGPMIAGHAEQALKQEEYASAQIEQVSTMEAAVQRAAQIAQPGDVVLLSPGGTSFDAYKDFAARGEHFRELVSGLEADGG